MNRAFILILLLLASGKVFSEDKSGGCGLGWKIAPKNSMVSFTTRATTNTYTMTFGTTTGTSGCARHSIVLNEKMKEHFSVSNYDQLIVEMANGRGENLMAFSRSFGCDGVVVNHFSHTMKKNFDVMKMDTPYELVDSVQDVIRGDVKLSKSCSLI